jgi:hypothetical protein
MGAGPMESSEGYGVNRFSPRRIRKMEAAQAHAEDLRVPHLFICLTREEFKLCFALAFIESQGREDYGGAIGLDRFPTPGTKAQADSWEEEVRRAIRYLDDEHGFQFEGIQAGNNGSLQCHPIEEGNMVYVLQMKDGGLPNVLSALQQAIAWGEQYPSLPLDTFRAVERDVQASLESIPRLDPDIQASLEELDAAALNAVGVVRGPRGSGEVN